MQMKQNQAYLMLMKQKSSTTHAYETYTMQMKQN